MSTGIMQLFEDAETLSDQKRFLPAVQALEEARRLTQIPGLRAWASYNLGTIHWHFLGDGLSARQEFLAASEIFDQHGYGQNPKLQVVHANALENMMLCALSFDEFEDFAARLGALAPNEPILTGLVPEVRACRERGTAWSDVLFDFASRNYNRNDPKRDAGRYGQAKATYQLLLTHRRDLRFSREDWGMAVYEYCALSMRMASDCIKARGGDEDPNPPEEFLPILTEACPLVDEYLAAYPGDDGLMKVRQGMDEIVTNCRLRWAQWTRRPIVTSIEPFQFPAVQRVTEKRTTSLSWLIILLLLPPLLFSLAFSPLIYFYTFMAAALIAFLSSRSRRVVDPPAGIYKARVLPPGQFHQWANFVCSDAINEKLYQQYFLDQNRPVGDKLPVVFSHLKAINYVFARRILLILLLPLNAYCLYDLFLGMQSYYSPILMGAITGLAWGYAVGLYVQWRTCQRAWSQGE